MKDTKSLLLLILSLLLIVVSLALLWTWGYNYGREKSSPPIVNHDTFSAGLLSEDSLNDLYNQAVSNLSNLDSALTKADSMKLDISDKLSEFYKLRDEIAAMQSKSDLNSEKNISELQSKVAELSNQNHEIIKENERLMALLRELTKKNQNPDAAGSLNPQKNDPQPLKTKPVKEKNSKTKSNPVVSAVDSGINKTVSSSIKDSGKSNPTINNTKPEVSVVNPPKKSKPTVPVTDQSNNTATQSGSKPVKVVKTKEAGSSNAAFFTLSEMNISGLYLDDNKYVETDLANQTSKFSGSFVLKNNRSVIKYGDIHIVISRPDGKLLQSSTWDAGTFETSAGRRIYSTKVKYDCDIGESKKINFSISADQYPKGNYSFDFYQNGYIIGKTAKSLQ